LVASIQLKLAKSKRAKDAQTSGSHVLHKKCALHQCCHPVRWSLEDETSSKPRNIGLIFEKTREKLAKHATQIGFFLDFPMWTPIFRFFSNSRIGLDFLADNLLSL
jgi:hypothetical protein